MLGNTLKEHMRERGIKQVFVAEKAGISPQVLGTILNEQRKIEAAEFFKICEAAAADPIEIAKRACIYQPPAKETIA